MPYDVKKQGGKWAIVRTSDNKVVGRSETKGQALASVRARMANEKGAGGGKGR
jgi:hypothetical protein